MSRSLCEEHNWEIDPNGCPVCEGMEIVKKRVRELHFKLEYKWKWGIDYTCNECSELMGAPVQWPCPTIKALDGETE